MIFLVQRLANHAITNTEHQAIRAEACYQLGRCYHKQHDFEQAFKFYYQGNSIGISIFLKIASFSNSILVSKICSSILLHGFDVPAKGRNSRQGAGNRLF